MVRKILVALNRSDTINQSVFQEALTLAKATGASLKLLHVLPVDDDDSPGILALLNTPENRQRWEEFERPGLEMLRSLTEQALSAGVSAEYLQELGRPGHVICDNAQRWQADLVMMGRRGLTGIGELVLGSVSNYVTHYAPCSVLVVQCQKQSCSEENASQTMMAATH
jgi:nucleotide-binding universal stress UspA family protein